MHFRIYVLREILPLYGENYDETWGHVSYKDKTVLDLGADYGSTAYYFLKKGARKIIAVEGDKSLALKLVHNYGKDARVTCVQKWIDSSEDIEELIKLYSSDLVKVDIEGAEKHIAHIPSVTLLSINEWLIEVHTKGIYDELSKIFLKLGFKVFAFDYDIVGVYKILCARVFASSEDKFRTDERLCARLEESTGEAFNGRVSLNLEPNKTTTNKTTKRGLGRRSYGWPMLMRMWIASYQGNQRKGLGSNSISERKHHTW